PKTLASRHSEWLSFRYRRPFAIVEWVLAPFALLLNWIGATIVNLSGGRIGTRQLVNIDLLRSVISLGHREGAVDMEEATMLHKVLSFGDRRVREVMTPRTEMVWMHEDTRLADFLDTYDRTPRSRFPMYKEDVDNVVGILHTSDVIRAMHKGRIQQDSGLLQLVRPARFVPETKPMDDLFAEMRSAGSQMFLVVDEYGGVAGLVTMQQLVGAITGWVGEEGEEPEEEVESLGEGTFQVDGGMQVTEANEVLGLGIPEGEYETVAGFLLDSLGRIPREGETFRHGHTRLKITEMKGVKIEKVLVTKP
ncbi:MAG: hemolysin family protein, partial [Dehalococcoidia bacterium]